MTDKLYLHGIATQGENANIAKQELEVFILNHEQKRREAGAKRVVDYY